MDCSPVSSTSSTPSAQPQSECNQPIHPSPALDLTIDLLVRANRGDQSAWNILVDRHLAPLKLVARRRLPAYMRSMTDTDDVVQDALLNSIKHLRHFDCRGRGALLA